MNERSHHPKKETKMPPKRQNFADKSSILLAIHFQIEDAVAGIEADMLAAPPHYRGKFVRELADVSQGWVLYDLVQFSGNPDLSESQKQVWRKAVRELEASCLVERETIYIRLTDSGKELVLNALDSTT